MKWSVSLIIFFALIASSLTGIKVESHEDHSHEEIHSQDLTYHAHAHETEKKTDHDAQKDCPHFHLHCSSLCMGVVLSEGHQLQEVASYQAAHFFLLSQLHSQKHLSQIYRPPIA